MSPPLVGAALGAVTLGPVFAIAGYVAYPLLVKDGVIPRGEIPGDALGLAAIGWIVAVAVGAIGGSQYNLNADRGHDARRRSGPPRPSASRRRPPPSE